MHSQARVDPVQLKTFAAKLEATALQAKGQTIANQSLHSQLGQFWKDDNFKQFTKLYAETMIELSRFLSDCEAMSTYIRKKAELAERVGSHRF